MKRPSLLALAGAALSLSLAAPASAGIYGDSLSKCLIESTTPADKTTLVRWIFAIATLNPEVKTLSAVTPAMRTEANRQAAQMFQTLLTKTCVTEARKAVDYEGRAVFEQSFNQLGQVAGRELFGSPDVAAGMAELQQFIDKKAIEKAFAK